MIVGLLALQGDYAAHAKRLKELSFETKEVRTVADVDAVDALVIPGGESSVFLKLLSPELKVALRDKISSGTPTLATCAGVILLAKNVENPKQESLDLIDIDVQRNAYGRQVDSFITPKLALTTKGEEFFGERAKKDAEYEGVFIRAPRISRIGKEVTPVFQNDQEIVGVAYENILALTFHPELSEQFNLPYQFLQQKLSH